MKQVEHTNSEQRMLASVQHPFIINLWGTFQDCSNLYMVMDFVPGGELFTLLRRSNVCLLQSTSTFPKFMLIRTPVAINSGFQIQSLNSTLPKSH